MLFTRNQDGRDDMCKVGECIMCGANSFWLISDGALYGKYCSWKCHDEDEQMKEDDYEHRIEGEEQARRRGGESWC